MLNCYDLYDIYAVLINIRRKPELKKNKEIVESLLKVVKKSQTIDDLNLIRKALMLIKIEDADGYSFVNRLNEYTYVPFFIKKRDIYEILIFFLNELLEVINSGNINQISDVASAIHNLPILLAENNQKIPKCFWKYDVKEYEKRWKVCLYKKWKKIHTKL